MKITLPEVEPLVQRRAPWTLAAKDVHVTIGSWRCSVDPTRKRIQEKEKVHAELMKKLGQCRKELQGRAGPYWLVLQLKWVPEMVDPYVFNVLHMMGRGDFNDVCHLMREAATRQGTLDVMTADLLLPKLAAYMSLFTPVAWAPRSMIGNRGPTFHLSIYGYWHVSFQAGAETRPLARSRQSPLAIEDA